MSCYRHHVTQDYHHRIGAQPLGCRSIGLHCGAGRFHRLLELPRFCSLKAALLCGGGSVKKRPLAALSERLDSCGVAITSQVAGFGMAWLIPAELRAVPPTAAQRLKERRGVSVTIGLGLNEVHRGLLVDLFRG